MVPSNFVIFPYKKTDYIDCLIGYVSMLQERSSVCSISCMFHNSDVISPSVLKTYDTGDNTKCRKAHLHTGNIVPKLN
jgi:hypothetical protein